MDLKRQGSFNRLQRVPEQVEEWFRTSTALHDAMESFAKQYCKSTLAFEKPIDNQAHLSPVDSHRVEEELDHRVFDLLKTFINETVEAQLSIFREEHKLTDSEFDAVIQLSMDEEGESRNFFRWTEVSSMPAFLILMRTAAKVYGPGCEPSSTPHPSVAALLNFIDHRSLDARNQYRRKTRLRPLLTKWCPASFTEILGLIEASASEVPPNLDLAQKKNLARWRLKLSTKAIGPGGVEIAPPRNEEEWLQYLERYCESMSDATFESFMAFAEAFLGGRAEEGEELKDRRASWMCFQQLDPLHTGAVYLEDLLEELECFDALFTADAQRKIVFRKLRLKVDAEERNIRSDSSQSVGSERHPSLVAKALETVGCSPPTLGASGNECVGSISAQSAEAGEGSSHSVPSDAAHGHCAFVLLNMNQFHRALDFVYKNCRNPGFRQNNCRTFRSFVIALHKLIAQHCDVASPS
jgi:hypothetical protein